MRSLTLSTKISLVSGIVLVAMSLASFGVLYRAQHQLIVREMDTLLSSETLALSALVDAGPRGNVDFEMSPRFYSHYQRFKPARFFRFIEPKTGHILKQSPGAPAIGCNTGSTTIFNAKPERGHEFRVMISHFQPEIDSDARGTPHFSPNSLCLVVGLDEHPYHVLLSKTLLSTVPLLVIFALLFAIALRLFVKRLASDLSRLTSALETADFSATHAFPQLPEAHTPEVKAVREKLAALHGQAADVYQEMWLFLGRAAHQIKTPIAAMQATVQVLLRRDRSKEDLVSGLRDVETATNQLSALTRKLVSSSRMSYQVVSNLEKIDLKRFLYEQSKRFSALAEQCGVKVALQSNHSLNVWANPTVLEDIFGNLIENAILYSPKNADADVSITWKRQGHWADVFISDRGKGFSREVTQFLFKPFVRGDERTAPGSGLGLSIAKTSARLLGGDVSLMTSTENGSTLAVKLRFAEDMEFSS